MRDGAIKVLEIILAMSLALFIVLMGNVAILWSALYLSILTLSVLHKINNNLKRNLE